MAVGRFRGRDQRVQSPLGVTTLLEALYRSVGPQTRITYGPDWSLASGADVLIVVLADVPYAEVRETGLIFVCQRIR
ncbi:MAG: hypothetical protein RMN51_12055 [Verrucomicrobiota bacterium]|nr:hypothetical protein [Limisphaera sp.]MDW8382824.1 hypothetical protein [Verrucomicrobiota bacterium]